MSEIANKCNPDYWFVLTSVGDGVADVAEKPKRVLRRYRLDGDCEGLVLTQREAECMWLLMRGSTIRAAGEQLGLSPRTVEFYLKNIKRKMGVSRKGVVIERLRRSCFAEVNELHELECDER